MSENIETLRRKAKWHDINERILTSCGGGVFFSSLVSVFGAGIYIQIIAAIIGAGIGYYTSFKTQKS